MGSSSVKTLWESGNENATIGENKDQNLTELTERQMGKAREFYL